MFEIDKRVVIGISRMLAKTCENIEFMVCQIPELSSLCDDMILDELNHAQVMILELTKMLTGLEEPAENEDEGSVFAAGDLESVIENENTAKEGEK